MNRVSTLMMVIFGGGGLTMVLIGRELKDRGGEAGEAARVFEMIGMIWTGVAILLLVLFLLVGRGMARSAARRAEELRTANEGSDGPA